MFKRLFLKTSVLFLVGAFLLTGCAASLNQPAPAPVNKPNNQGNNNPSVEPGAGVTTGGTIEEQLQRQSQIKKFTNYEDLAAFLENSPTSGNYGGGIAVPGAMTRTTVGNAVAKEITSDAGIGLGATPTVAPSAPVQGSHGMEGASQDYSQTNNQVKGVDEADIVKTDGKYIYTLSRNNVFIVEAYPADTANILAKIAFKSRPLDMFISGDRLIVFGSDDLVYKNEAYSHFRRQNQYAFLKIFDISDRKNPKQIRDLDFEGNYRDSRLIGDNLYFITDNYGFYFVPGEPVVPRLLEDGVVLPNKCAAGEKCFAPAVYYFDFPYSSYNFTNVSVVNVKEADKAVTGEAYILSGGQNIYVSQNSIYITYTKYISEYQLEMNVFKELIFSRLSVKEQSIIQDIEATKNYILSADEKAQKINVILERYVYSLSADAQKNLETELQAAVKKKYEDISKELEKTVIHKIAIKGDTVEYKATGEVTGNVLNQFSMDESNGYFRIATTKNRTWLPYYLSSDTTDTEKAQLNSYSNIYVLDDKMQIAGKIENLEPGERIYSARFMQNRAYLVTFQQTDPLFVIDLSNPAAPKVLGKLKMPGYSSYLHPYDNNLLIGLGKNTDTNQWGGVTTKGLKLSLYDVSDVSNPKEVDTYNFDNQTSDSIALNDHKAFLFSQEKNLLVIPFTENSYGSPVSSKPMPMMDGVSAYRYQFFSGAAVFKVTEKGFELKGKIAHPDIASDSVQDCWWGYCYYDNNILRSLFISDTLYTFSNQVIKANKITDLKEVKTLELKKEKIGRPSDIEITN